MLGDMPRGELLAMVLREMASGELLREWFSGPPQVALLERTALLVPAALILLGAIALGWLVVSRIRPGRFSRLESVVFSAAVGLSLTSTWVLIVGLLGGLRLRWLVVAPLPIAVAAAAWQWWRSTPTAPPCPAPTQSGPSDRWLWLAAPLLLLLVAGAVLPPSDFDVREYHLQAPKEFYQAGRITFLPHNVYANMPLGTEMLSLLAMVAVDDWWRGALVGKLLTASFAVWGALGVLAAGRRWFSSGAGVVAALVYLSTPWILLVCIEGLIDAALAFYLLMAAYAFWLWREPNGLPSPALAGYMAGAAVATKYPGALFVALPLTAAVAWTGWRQAAHAGGRIRHAARPLAVFLLTVAVGCGLWLAKNWAATGNPVYPLLYPVFGGTGWDADKDARWNRAHRPHDFSPRALATDVARLGGQSPWHSPVLMPFAALALLASVRGFGRQPARQTLIVITGLIAYVLVSWWLFTHRIDRFWIPTLPLWCLLAGWGACVSRHWVWRKTLSALLLLATGYALLLGCSGAIGENRFFYPLAALRHDPQHADPWYRYFNDHARGQTVLLLGEAAVFDLEMPVLYATCFDDLPLSALAAQRGPAAVHAELLARKVAYVYVDWDEIERYRRPGNYGFSPIPQPALFHQLVAAGVLEPLPPLNDHAGRAYRVRSR
jgi:hypothetical protein